MQVRRPSAIFRCRPYFREFLSPRNFLTYSKPAKRLQREMPVQREKILSTTLSIEAVPQNDDRTVIEWRLVIRKSVHYSVERCTHRASRRHLQIDSQMNRATLVGG